jgi:LuxR family maltose regulon positive regulatory protein
MYAIEARHTVADSVGERSALILRTPGVDIVDQVLPVLINELDALPERAEFVLEDYHAINRPEVHEAVSYLIDHAPSSLELVVSTRVEPPLPVQRASRPSASRFSRARLPRTGARTLPRSDL